MVLDHRDWLAADTMLRAPNAPDGVLVWGAGHLPGISARLAGDGFRCVKTGWRSVGRLPGLVASLRIVKPVETIGAIRRRRRSRSA